MNVSAPASVPGLAGPAHLFAAPRDPAVKSAPSRSTDADEATSHSFRAALKDVLHAESEPKEKLPSPDRQDEAKTMNAAVTMPAPPPEALPFQLAIPTLQAIAPNEAPPLTELYGAKISSAKSGPGKTSGTFAKTGVEPGSPAVAVAHLDPDPSGKAQLPQTAETPRGPASILQSVLDASASGYGRPDLQAIRELRVVAEDAASPLLPNLAFAARLTPIQATAVTEAATSTIPVTNGTPHSGAAAASEPALPASGAVAAEAVTKSTAPDHANDRRNQNEAQGHPEKAQAPAEPAAHAATAMESSIRLDASTPVTAPAMEPQAAVASQSAPPPHPADIRQSDTAPVEPATNPHPVEADAISLRLADTGDQRVDLRVSNRGGEVHVAVRTADPDLAGPLRENLGELVRKLEQSGFRAETWHPAQSGSMDSNQQQGRPDSESFPGGRQQQQQQQQQPGRERHQQDSKQPRWAQEMENSFAPDSKRSASK